MKKIELIIIFLIILWISWCWENWYKEATQSYSQDNFSYDLQSWSSNKKFMFNKWFKWKNWDLEYLKWVILVESWNIIDINFDSSQNSNKQFSNIVKNLVVWKEIKWLKIDSISWASYETQALNTVLEEYK